MKFPMVTLHNHTTFCDGENTPEEMVRAAIGQGIRTIGFSGHSYTPFDPSWCMSEEGTVRYREEILRLKDAYREKIEILLGIERDFFAAPDSFPYDFVIGSVHYILADDGAICQIDETEEIVREDIRDHFGGNAYRWIRRYYETVERLKEKTACDIVGHFDLVEKFNADNRIFDPHNTEYRIAAHRAAERLIRENVIFEINTGSMRKGYRAAPYPSQEILRTVAGEGGRVLLSADSHDCEGLLYAFPQAAQYAASCGVSGFSMPR